MIEEGKRDFYQISYVIYGLFSNLVAVNLDTPVVLKTPKAIRIFVLNIYLVKKKVIQRQILKK